MLSAIYGSMADFYEKPFFEENLLLFYLHKQETG